jgi:hypothetical protein
MNRRRPLITAAALLFLPCCSDEQSESARDAYLLEVFELECSQAEACDCRFGYSSVSECVETRMAFSRAWRPPGSENLHFDEECANEWLLVNERVGCSSAEPWLPGCYITYGDVGEGAYCNMRDECEKGLRCLEGTCRTWGALGDICRFNRDCDWNTYCGPGGICEQVPSAGESCVSECENGSFCYEGNCAAYDAPCGGCPRGEVCAEFECIVPLPNGAACSQSSQCQGKCDQYGNTCIDYDPFICSAILGSRD